MAPPELAAKLKEGALPTQVIQVPNANLASIDWAVKLKVSLSTASSLPELGGVWGGGGVSRFLGEGLSFRNHLCSLGGGLINASLASIDLAVKLNVRLAKYPPRFDGVREGL